MPKYKVTILRHQWAEIEIDAETEDAAFDAVQAMIDADADRVDAGSDWITSLLEANDVASVRP
jgi:hypothetical protein